MKLLWVSALANFFVLASLLQESQANLWELPSIPENRTEVLEEWKAIDKGLKDTVKSLMKSLMPLILEATSQVNISSKCVSESLQLLSGLRNLKKWAFQFVDSSAKMVDGTLAGTVTFLGVYQECMDTVVPHSKRPNETLFRGQYCTAELRLPLPHMTRRYRLFDHLEAVENFTGSEILKFLTTKAHLFYFIPYKVGLCIPSGCSQNDLLQLLQYAGGKVHLDVEVAHCETKEPKKLFKVHIAAIVVSSVLGILVLLGTCIEIHSNHKKVPRKNLGCRILLCFSMVNNFKRLASTKRSTHNLRCLHGFRFLSITWIVLGHCYFYPTWFARSYQHLFFTLRMAGEPVAQMIINGSEAVDSFILMSGILLGYLSVKHVIVDKKRFKITSFIFHRLWRIVPVYYFIILFAMLSPLMGSGPLFQETMEESVNPCYEYWWRNLLFINNFYHLKDVCMMHTWYISCDMQLFIASLLVLLPMFKSERIGVTINVIIIIVSVAYSGTITYLKDVLPTIIITHLGPEDRNHGYLYTYSNTLSRAGPYFLGTLVGYILATKPNIKISKKIQAIGWCLATLSSGCVVFLTCLWYGGEGPRFLDVVMYATFYKVAFSGGIAWMIFCCVTGHGGVLNSFLSWNVWVPLSKLSFLIYLIQPLFQTLYIANFHSTQEHTHLHAIIHFFGFLGISSLLAMICNLLVESPFMAMEKLTRPEKSESTKTKEENGGEINYALSNDSFRTSNGKPDDGMNISPEFVRVSKL